ncbi:hypothetical protein FGB62_356g01 [Gracilaria domingensis]|nr:hypothetical protein FGB62_356g01 [Gracilaria domingensis]
MRSELQHGGKQQCGGGDDGQTARVAASPALRGRPDGRAHPELGGHADRGAERVRDGAADPAAEQGGATQ